MSDVTARDLDQYRELVKFGSAIGVGGTALAELLDHIDALQADRDRLAAELAAAQELLHKTEDEKMELRAELSAARADAERYRWLCGWREWPEAVEAAFDCSGKVLIDIAIDAAMATVIEDGFGNAWTKCKPDCRMEIVRPGKVQCDCDSYRAALSAGPALSGMQVVIDPTMPEGTAELRCGESRVPIVPSAGSALQKTGE